MLPPHHNFWIYTVFSRYLREFLVTVSPLRVNHVGLAAEE